MALRLIELVLPDKYMEQVRGLMESEPLLNLDYWLDKSADAKMIMKALVKAEKSEPIMDEMEKRFSAVEGFRLILLPVEAAIPAPGAEDPEPSQDSGPDGVKDQKTGPLRISREELHAEVADTTKISGVYIAMVVFSAIVASHDERETVILRSNATKDLVSVIQRLRTTEILHPLRGFRMTDARSSPEKQQLRG